MNDSFTKLKLASQPIPHYMSGETPFHLGAVSRTQKETVRPPIDSFRRSIHEKKFPTAVYIDNYTKILRKFVEEPDKESQNRMTSYYDVLSR